jgi:lactate dehydrogenase-like 2-hydroxyacid dehydrogenase
MPHVLVAGKLHPSGIALLHAAPGVTFDYVEDVSEASYAPLIRAADGLVIRTQPLSAPTVARADRLRIVSRHGVGYDAVDLPSLNSKGIALSIVGDVNSISVAEHAMMLLLACAKQLLRSHHSVREGHWSWRNRLEATELFGKRLLIMGFGRTGRRLAKLADPKHDMRDFAAGFAADKKQVAGLQCLGEIRMRRRLLDARHLAGAAFARARHFGHLRLLRRGASRLEPEREIVGERGEVAAVHAFALFSQG